jgi:VCBS repeat-containing protein
MIASLGIGAAFAVSAAPAAAEVETPYPGPSVTIPSSGPASPYPSTITVGDVGTVVSVRVTLNELAHNYTADLNIALQPPNGSTVVLLAGCRGAGNVNGTLTFADDGEVLLRDSVVEPLGTGTYAPSRCMVPVFGDPSPCPCKDSLATLAGGDANGDWKLWVFDDATGDSGSMAGWTLELTTNAAPVAGDGSFSGPRDVLLRDTLAGLASDVDDDELDFEAASEPAHGTLLVSTNGTFNYTPDDGFVGDDTFTYRVDDGLTSDEGEVTITVTDIGDDRGGPEANPTVSPEPNASGWHDRDVTVVWNWTDVDADIDPDHCTTQTT